MGKVGFLQQQQQSQHDPENPASSAIFCGRCSTGLSRFLTFKCVVVLILGLAALLSGIFWILPSISQKSGFDHFDARESIRLRASVQAYFRLPKPVSEIVPYVRRLEYDIYGEVAVPYTKVAVLSMHQSSITPNWTDVVFGVLSDPIAAPINPVSLTVLKSSLIELFFQTSNLTLTTSIFGQPSTFQILKCPGGITVNPTQYTSIWQIPQALFNFTLYDTISDIRGNFTPFKAQLKVGLRLKSYENVFVLISNKVGSTITPPVVVQATVISDLGSLMPQRLKQLAEAIEGSPTDNLGLSNSTFGRVKSIMLSSYLEHSLQTMPPTPSPAPSPGETGFAGPSISPIPALSPSLYPAPLPSPYLSPCLNCKASTPSDYTYPPAPSPKTGVHDYSPTENTPAPSVATPGHPKPCPGSDSVTPPRSSLTPQYNGITPASSPHSVSIDSPPIGLAPHFAPGLLPMPVVSYGSGPRQGKSDAGHSLVPSPSRNISPSVTHSFYKEICLLGLTAVIISLLSSSP